MNEIFNFRRFSKVLKYDFNIVLEKYLKSTLPILLLAYCILGILKILAWNFIVPSNRIVMITFLALLISFVAPYSVYSYVNHRSRGVAYISLPASVLEKYLSMILYSVVLMPLVAFASLYAADTIMVLVAKLFGAKGDGLIPFREFYYLFTDDGAYFVLLLLTATAVCGNLLFRKNKIVKTLLGVAAANFLLLIAFSSYIIQMIKPLLIDLPIQSDSGVMMEFLETNLDPNYSVFTVILALIPVILLVITYWKLNTQKY